MVTSTMTTTCLRNAGGGKEKEGRGKGMELEREKEEKREGGYSSAMGFERRGERDVLDSTLSLNHEKTSRSPKAKG